MACGGVGVRAIRSMAAKLGPPEPQREVVIRCAISRMPDESEVNFALALQCVVMPRYHTASRGRESVMGTLGNAWSRGPKAKLHSDSTNCSACLSTSNMKCLRLAPGGAGVDCDQTFDMGVVRCSGVWHSEFENGSQPVWQAATLDTHILRDKQR